jgi:hypothetical protein
VQHTWETGRDLSRGERSHIWVTTESDGGETHGGGESEGDREPSETTKEVSLDAGSGLGRNSTLLERSMLAM